MIIMIIVSGTLALIFIGLYGGELYTPVVWPSPAPFTVPPHFTSTPPDSENTYPTPNFQIANSFAVPDVAPCIIWNDEAERGAYITISPSQEILSISFLIRVDGEMVSDPVNPPEHLSGVNFYNGSSMQIIKDLKTSHYVLLLSGVTGNQRGFVYYFTLTDGVWSESRSFTRSPTSRDGDQFGKSIGVTYDILTQRTFIAVSTSIGVANQYGAVQLWKYTYPSTLVMTTSLEIGDTSGFSTDCGYGNSLAFNSGTLLVGCPGFIQDDGSIGHVFHFIFDYVSGTWSQAQGISSLGRDSLGSSLAINDKGNRLLVGAPNSNGSKGTVRYYALNGDKDGQGIIGWDLISVILAPTPIDVTITQGLRFGQVMYGTGDMRYIVISNFAPNNEQYLWVYRLEVLSDLYQTNNQSVSFNTAGDPEAVDIYTKTELTNDSIIYLKNPFAIGVFDNLCNLVGVSTVHNHVVNFSMDV